MSQGCALHTGSPLLSQGACARIRPQERPTHHHSHSCTAQCAMITITYLPVFVTLLFRGMPGLWKSRHRLLLCWLVVMQAPVPGRKTLEELARWTPAQITVWRFRRINEIVFPQISDTMPDNNATMLGFILC